MSVTSTIQYADDHIARCTCGQWVMLTHSQLKSPMTCVHGSNATAPPEPEVGVRVLVEREAS